MADDDDFITVNITCDQSSALTMILMMAVQNRMVDMLPPDLRHAFISFVEMMTMEIQRQKLNALGSN